MTQQLYTGLIANRVNFEEDYRKWQKGTMIEKIATVMGIEYPDDPDESYVLTVDNLIKMLAIQMRFRSVCLLFCLPVYSLSVHLSVCLMACILSCIHAHARTHVRTYTHTCMHMHTHTHAHTHTHTHRCGIPVIIMGETGCGKTRLIRYMCDLARQGMERNNMLIMKVSLCFM